MLKGFRDFILRGNVMDLAVAVIIGAAFTAIVTALTEKIINPLLGAVIGKPNFGYLVGHINGGEIRYGDFLTAIVNFLLIAAVVYFFLVLPSQYLLKKYASRSRRYQALPPMPQRHPRSRHPLQVLHPARLIRRSSPLGCLLRRRCLPRLRSPKEPALAFGLLYPVNQKSVILSEAIRVLCELRSRRTCICLCLSLLTHQ